MIFNGLELAVVYVLAALGGLISERAGILNIALEGLMLGGGFCAILITAATGSPVLGLLGAVMAGGLVALVQAGAVLKLGADAFITGLAVNLLVPALSGLLLQAWFGTVGVLRLPGPETWSLDWPLVANIPVLGEILSGHGIFYWVTWICLVFFHFLLQRTPWGLRLAAAGSQPDLLRITGRSPDAYRTLALVVSGVWAALAGAVLALRLGAYVPGMTAGRGWIALVVVYLGYKRPWGLAAAALIFSGAEVASQNLQGVPQIPSGVVLALPYLITLVALVIYSLLQRARSQAS